MSAVSLGGWNSRLRLIDIVVVVIVGEITRLRVFEFDVIWKGFVVAFDIAGLEGVFRIGCGGIRYLWHWRENRRSSWTD